MASNGSRSCSAVRDTRLPPSAIFSTPSAIESLTRFLEGSVAKGGILLRLQLFAIVCAYPQVAHKAPSPRFKQAVTMSVKLANSIRSLSYSHSTLARFPIASRITPPSASYSSFRDRLISPTPQLPVVPFPFALVEQPSVVNHPPDIVLFTRFVTRSFIHTSRLLFTSDTALAPGI